MQRVKKNMFEKVNEILIKFVSKIVFCLGGELFNAQILVLS